MNADPRPQLAAIWIADPPERWEALGFSLDDDTSCNLGGVRIHLGAPGAGITAWSIRAARGATTDIDGLATEPLATEPLAAEPAPTGTLQHPVHPNGASALDHIVVVTPDFDRTSRVLARAGMALRRVRRVGDEHDVASFRQGFRRLGPAILELVETKAEPATGPARFWGLVVIVEDLDGLKGRLQDVLGEPRPAVQPGRRIATLGEAAGLTPRVAFMSPEPDEHALGPALRSSAGAALLVQPQDPRLVHRRVCRADGRAGAGMAGDRLRRARPDLRPDRVGQDAGCVPVGDRPAGRRAGPTGGRPHTRLVYVSPLKALSYDIERNLRVPLRGIGAELSVAVRTGDTPQRERQAMLRKPPDILITTPESLYLMLTGRAQELFAGARWCIIDEIHAVAATKRGSHLALTLERLAAPPDARSAADRAVGHAEPARGGRRGSWSARGARAGSSIPACARSSTSRSTCRSSRWSSPTRPPPRTSTRLAGGEATRRSIWPAIYPELLELIQSHRSTILFVNNRRGAERLALRLNEPGRARRSRAPTTARWRARSARSSRSC